VVYESGVLLFGRQRLLHARRRRWSGDELVRLRNGHGDVSVAQAAACPVRLDLERRVERRWVLKRHGEGALRLESACEQA
jgi:hypothetical protein